RAVCRAATPRDRPADQRVAAARLPGGASGGAAGWVRGTAADHPAEWLAATDPGPPGVARRHLFSSLFGFGASRSRMSEPRARKSENAKATGKRGELPIPTVGLSFPCRFALSLFRVFVQEPVRELNGPRSSRLNTGAA